MDKVKELFERLYCPYNTEINEEEIALLNEEALKHNYLAELTLIILDFSRSTIHYSPLTGTIDELDETQMMCFDKLEKLGEVFPFAYEVAGELYLGKMGKIVFHSDKALSYFQQYTSKTGDSEIVDNYEEYTHVAWKDYLEISKEQAREKYHQRVGKTITYSHDPLYYEDLNKK